jgi:hypothetical protein
MPSVKPSPRIWKKVNEAILDENAGEVMVTLIGGMTSLLIANGVCESDRQARVHLAAMLLSPDTGAVGSLVKDLPAEFARLMK